jgi:isopenicillin N synthase-like dioxygenase
VATTLAFQQTFSDELPLIDVSALRSGTPREVVRLADRLGSAARDVGFFRICNHGISLDLIDETYRAAERFFAQTEAEKQRYYIGRSLNHRGYVPFTEKGDYIDEIHRNYEAFDLALDLPESDPDFLAGNLVLGPNVWPDLDGFKVTVSRYYSEVALLGRLICGALEMFLGLAKGSITDQMTKPVSQLRLLHYVRPEVTKDHSSVNMGAHTDYECLTLLHTRNEGLQVMTHADHWIDVPVDHSAYVVNIGDMLEAWTNGILRSTPHRVVNRSRERFSMPYFVAANHNTVIRPFPQLIGDARSSKYEPFQAGAHLERMLLRDFPYLRQRQLLTAAKASRGASGAYSNPFETRLHRSSV